MCVKCSRSSTSFISLVTSNFVLKLIFRVSMCSLKKQLKLVILFICWRMHPLKLGSINYAKRSERTCGLNYFREKDIAKWKRRKKRIFLWKKVCGLYIMKCWLHGRLCEAREWMTLLKISRSTFLFLGGIHYSSERRKYFKTWNIARKSSRWIRICEWIMILVVD